ncbi:MAG: hypothetical protein ACJAZ9_001276, partial [Neolewinella sp.]
LVFSIEIEFRNFSFKTLINVLNTNLITGLAKEVRA